MNYQSSPKSIGGKTKPRLARFVKSGLCPVKKATEFAEELKRTARNVCNQGLIRTSSKFFKALSDPTRLKIVRLLTLRDMCVCEIMVALEITQPVASHHLQILESAGLLTKRRQGKWVFYSLANPQIVKMLDEVVSAKNLEFGIEQAHK